MKFCEEADCVPNTLSKWDEKGKIIFRFQGR